MIPDWGRRPQAGSSGWALARLRRAVLLKTYDPAYRRDPQVCDLVNRAIISCFRDVRDCGDVEAFKQAQRVMVPRGVYRPSSNGDEAGAA